MDWFLVIAFAVVGYVGYQIGRAVGDHASAKETERRIKRQQLIDQGDWKALKELPD